ncbi:MAG: hypothetical protein K2W82_02535 [Candidatus Obscuribacterales bacterium]|nr:hypothetical protein [Candidatus Obscuribacterales bacterium]
MISTKMIVKRIFLASLTLSMLVVGFEAKEAKAFVSTTKIFNQYQARKTELLSEERDLEQDLVDLQRKIDELVGKRDNGLSGQINDLARSWDDTYYDLRRVRQDIRDLNLKML